ncbi:acyltransferase [Azoarcus taiwanensis]|uniref:LpxL/LpxP family acyltransferase n=1 Tax=Azoarcus taiwanensis TaxID=666964 RepID=UPI001B7D231A|nr:acyltransferase [Azoarcus taiwanensis]
MTHWSRMAEAGSALGINLTFTLYRVLGRRVTLLLLHPIVAWFFVRRDSARSASRAYLERLHAAGGFTHPPRAIDSYRHLYAFAVAALDKVAAWMGRVDPSRIDVPDAATIESIRESGTGALIIGSHLGNLEMARGLASLLGKRKITAIVYTDHAVRFNRILARANPGFANSLVQVSHFGPDTAIDLAQRIERGELLFIVGDRTPPVENGRTCRVDFLGAPAEFAQGPYILASILDCPVYLFFCLADGDRYRIHFEHFAERITLPRSRRSEALHEWTQRYADRLATHCRIAPMQWFNFYDFWRP